MKRNIFLFILFLFFLTVDAKFNNPITGYWQWSYNPNLGMTKESQTFFHVFEKGGKLVGEAFSIRDGKKVPLNHLKIQTVKREKDSYVLVLPWANHYYKGTISEDGSTISGFLRHHSQKDDLKLTRVENIF